jgi:hypothetical protein
MSAKIVISASIVLNLREVDRDDSWLREFKMNLLLFKLLKCSLINDHFISEMNTYLDHDRILRPKFFFMLKHVVVHPVDL